MSSSLPTDRTLSWRLHGKALQTAVLVAGVLLVLALAAAAYDLVSPVDRRPVPLELVSLVAKLVIAGGLAAIARRTASTSMWLLAGLAGLLALATVLTGMDLVDSVVDSVAVPLADATGLSEGLVHTGLFFAALGLAALGLLGTAWLKAQPDERTLVGVLILLFAIVGVFTGPVNAIAATGINREWLFAEDFGQAVVLAMMAGFATGLVVASQDQRGVRGRPLLSL